MNNRSEGLPRFRKPPVIETVLGVYFRPSDQFRSVQQGILWDRSFRSQFPTLEERPPVEEIHERYGDERLAPPSIRWRVSERVQPPRLWAVSENGQHVIQIQTNAFFANWLKTSDGATYRPYAERRKAFGEQIRQVEEFFREERIGPLEPTSWTITYINHIDYGGLSVLGPTLARTLAAWTNQWSSNWLPAIDNAVFDLAFPMPDCAGRLNVNLKPAVVLSDKREVLRLDLTARGQLKSNDATSALSAIDMGHEWIVRGFATLTTPELHQEWERIQ
jgi:uncharacterized protein (TIGR04255 family)